MKNNRLGVCLLLFIIVNAQLSQSSMIKHIVVLMEENRSFDHMFGFYPGVNGLTGKECNLVSTTNRSTPCIYVDKLEPMIAPCDPDHGTPATTSKIFGMDAVMKNNLSNPTMSGFVEWENKRGNAKTNYCDVMSMMTPDHVPIISSLASEFLVMDHFFAAHAGPTWPNRLFMLTGTSAGLTETSAWYHNKVGQLFPQQSIFAQLSRENMTWRNYYNDTPWELFLGDLAHHTENIKPMTQFFEDAKQGTLPAFSWLNPRNGINLTEAQGCNDQHPDHDVSLGEMHYKAVYEALRASPSWNDTLFVITYDEHGGYYDHVPTPLNVPPPGDGETSYPDANIKFDRLGVRIPTLLISPWIPKGVVLSQPPAAQKPYPNSEYTLTSIIATARKLLGMKSPPLTKRDAWSATFEQVLSLKEPRTDCPMHLPSARAPSPNYSFKEEAEMPINDLQRHIMTVHAHLGGIEFPKHIKKQGQVSEWQKEQFLSHSKRTHEWKQSKLNTTYSLTMRISYVQPYVGHAWNINKGSEVDYYTLSLRTTGTATPLCLDYKSGEPLVGEVVGVGNCYPSANPDTNRDTSQHWVWTSDNTIRPRLNTQLCLTSAVFEGVYDKVYLKNCADVVEQHWAYTGAAPGNGNSGNLFVGNYNLGVVATNATVVVN